MDDLDPDILSAQLVYIRKTGPNQPVELCVWSPQHQLIVTPLNKQTQLNLLKDLVQAL